MLRPSSDPPSSHSVSSLPPLPRRFFVVDGRNRPGTSFVDLPAAEAAASNGDVIRLRRELPCRFRVPLPGSSRFLLAFVGDTDVYAAGPCEKNAEVELRPK